MSPLSFYNSLSKKIENFNPIEPGQASIYHCGPTVYKRPHLGNMRRFLFADFLSRSLALAGFAVKEIMNLTDVGHLTQDELDAGEDKLEKEARENKRTPLQVADQVTKEFFADLAALNIHPADQYPRATTHIAAMQTLIARLLDRGHAYQTKSGVYFDIATFPHYGQLSGNTLAALTAGARVDVRTEKRHPADFALWKTGDSTHLQQWDSPWGQGYPGWHIECSAMSMAYLGQQIDIHTGGEDNKFPHHENEIAQSEGATGETFVRLWLHNAHLKMSGQKLAKREGEQLTIDTLIEHGYSPLAFRLFAFGAHYRTPLDFSWPAMDAAQKQLDTLKQFLRRLANVNPPDKGDKGLPAIALATTAGGFAQDYIDSFQSALSDDLNTPAALATFWNYVRAINQQIDTNKLTKKDALTIWETLLKMDQVIGLIEPLLKEIATETIPEEITELAQKREKARTNNDFKLADSLRQQIQEKGYLIEDTPQGPRIIKQ